MAKSLSSSLKILLISGWLFFSSMNLILFKTQLTVFVHAGIEDAFKTAATEVSLLAGTDEFNATELFGVGKKLSFSPFPFCLSLSFFSDLLTADSS